ncbi:hypothetical protein NM952_02985 [Pasteurella multocida subsp. multocida]|uniref:Uncharacterized protein n=1 Tax=Pasteurella multocida TaxID=747 RepID=A0A9X3ZKS5_PASMD|nr:hypothetical protein [Pasteurella multocida]MBF6981000.1 hypothetical protein [Pasteurella multocida]MDA5609679.1 hypothetical protein [Pasteurella multocida]MDA5612429.1 hypothetical protein [Pasteurella multocida]MDA5615283.1 hypothetical protein [Pasteurella multocida]MDA5617573.1 hypothetical protein [Pasteurella multocida subsp. multocida]
MRKEPVTTRKIQEMVVKTPAEYWIGCDARASAEWVIHGRHNRERVTGQPWVESTVEIDGSTTTETYRGNIVAMLLSLYGLEGDCELLYVESCNNEIKAELLVAYRIDGVWYL